jgi:hypothetical protein
VNGRGAGLPDIRVDVGLRVRRRARARDLRRIARTVGGDVAVASRDCATRFMVRLPRG